MSSRSPGTIKAFAGLRGPNTTTMKDGKCECDVNDHDHDNKVNNKESSGENKRLKSGKCVKPDESDIKHVMKFAYEKLDVKHVQNQSFDSLPLHLLIAGEMEIISLSSTSEYERSA